MRNRGARRLWITAKPTTRLDIGLLFQSSLIHYALFLHALLNLIASKQKRADPRTTVPIHVHFGDMPTMLGFEVPSCYTFTVINRLASLTAFSLSFKARAFHIYHLHMHTYRKYCGFPFLAPEEKRVLRLGGPCGTCVSKLTVQLPRPPSLFSFLFFFLAPMSTWFSS